MSTPSAPIEVFISYAHADQELHKKLVEHLSPLKHSGKIITWQDQEILAGSNWDDHIQTRLREANVILLLVSASFIASNYCWDEEVQKALTLIHKSLGRNILRIMMRRRPKYQKRDS